MTAVATKPRILCVDDEPNVLAGMQLNLRREYDVVGAANGEQALQMLESTKDLAVLVCDMRMPKMNGAAVLTRARELAPDVTRILLTGQADLTSAISAVNDGQIFRFLTKPCDRDVLVAALRDAVRYHEVVTTEKLVLQQTLRGAIAALVDVLSLASPLAFGRATRVAKRATQLATSTSLPDVWQLEIAVSMQAMGYVSLSSETLDKMNAGTALTAAEEKQVARMPEVVEQIVSHIPRLEKIREILASAQRQATFGSSGENPIDRAGAILRLASDADAMESAGIKGPNLIDVLRKRGNYAAKLVDALEAAIGKATKNLYVADLYLSQLKAGMMIADDVLMNGALLVARGYMITQSFLERVKQYPPGAIREPVRILMTADVTVDQRAGGISK